MGHAVSAVHKAGRAHRGPRRVVAPDERSQTYRKPVSQPNAGRGLRGAPANVPRAGAPEARTALIGPSHGGDHSRR